MQHLSHSPNILSSHVKPQIGFSLHGSLGSLGGPVNLLPLGDGDLDRPRVGDGEGDLFDGTNPGGDCDLGLLGSISLSTFSGFIPERLLGTYCSHFNMTSSLGTSPKW